MEKLTEQTTAQLIEKLHKHIEAIEKAFSGNTNDKFMSQKHELYQKKHRDELLVRFANYDIKGEPKVLVAVRKIAHSSL